MVDDLVTEVIHYDENVGATHVIIPEGYMLVNDIAGSSRSFEDVSDFLFNVGLVIYKAFGLKATINFSKFGAWLSDTRVDRMLR